MLIQNRSKFATLVVLLVVFSSRIVSAQIGSSPYTGVGIGEINRQGFIHNYGKGGVGIAHGSVWYINTLNPAMLVFNTLSSFEVGLTTDTRKISDGISSQTNTSGNLSYLAFAFPMISNKWSMSVGMNPYSFINYDFQNTSLVLGSDSTEVVEIFNGKGGINQYYIANGFQLFKGFSAGFKVSFFAGSTIKDQFSALGPFEIIEGREVEAVFASGRVKQDYSLGLGVNLGVSYRISLKETDAITISAIYDVRSKLNTERLDRLEARTYNNEYRPIYIIDTLKNNTLSDNSGHVTIPAKLGVGIAYQKSNKLVLEANFTTQDWSKFKNFEGSNENLQKSWYSGFGIEFTPNPVSAKTYFGRVTYRAGFNYEAQPYYFNNTQINEYGVSAGASFPISRVSNLNIAFKYGQRGSTENGLLSENFYRISFGATFNDKWFNKRKFD